MVLCDHCGEEIDPCDRVQTASHEEICWECYSQYYADCSICNVSHLQLVRKQYLRKMLH